MADTVIYLSSLPEKSSVVRKNIRWREKNSIQSVLLTYFWNIAENRLIAIVFGPFINKKFESIIYLFLKSTAEGKVTITGVKQSRILKYLKCKSSLLLHLLIAEESFIWFSQFDNDRSVYLQFSIETVDAIAFTFVEYLLAKFLQGVPRRIAVIHVSQG